MKKFIVLRKNVFAGSLLPYWIIAGFRKDIFMEKYNFDGDLCEISAAGWPVPGTTIEEPDRIGIRINNGQIKEKSTSQPFGSVKKFVFLVKNGSFLVRIQI